MKKKQIIIGISIFVVALIATIVVAVYIKNNSNENINKQSKVDYFEIKETGGSKFKGSSIISKEQKIMLDKTNGELNEVFVEEGQYVKKDTELFSYHNEAISEQVDDLNRQIDSLNLKIEKEKDRVSKLNSLNNEEQTQESEVGFNETNKVQNLQGQQIETGSMVDELTANLNDIIYKRDSLNNKVTKIIKAEIDGKVYINNEDPIKEYMKIISEEPLISAEASEFDVDKLKIDDKVEIKVISNNKKITGKIIKIEEVPEISPNEKSVVYKFYIKPDESIKIGFSVELTVNPEKMLIPKSCVLEDDNKLYVKLIEGDSNKKVEIKATPKDDNYIIEDNTLKVGDKILINPLEDGKEEV